MENSLERELQLDAPASFSFARLEPQLAEIVRLHTIYYDTADLRLARWGCSLHFRLPDEWTLKLPLPYEGAALARTELVFRGDGTHIPDQALDLATAYLRGVRPTPVAELHTLRPSESSAAASAELAAATELGPRVAPVLAEPTIDRTSCAGDLFRAAFIASTQRLMRNDAAVRLGNDPEGVHQARVAVRRMRSDLRTFLPILNQQWATGLRERMRWLSDGLSAARDADVLLERLERQAQWLPDIDRHPKELVLHLLRGVRAAAYAQLRSMLRDRRYIALLDDVLDAARSPHFETRSQEPARELVPELMNDGWRKLRRAVRTRSRPPTDTELHGIRIRAKRVRYAAESVAPVCPRSAERFSDCIADLQAILGDQHDAVMSCEQLRQHVGGGDGAFVAGELTSLEREAADDARRQWRRAWDLACRPRLHFWEH